MASISSPSDSHTIVAGRLRCSSADGACMLLIPKLDAALCCDLDRNS